MWQCTTTFVLDCSRIKWLKVAIDVEFDSPLPYTLSLGILTANLLQIMTMDTFTIELSDTSKLTGTCEKETLLWTNVITKQKQRVHQVLIVLSKPHNLTVLMKLDNHCNPVILVISNHTIRSRNILPRISGKTVDKSDRKRTNNVTLNSSPNWLKWQLTSMMISHLQQLCSNL